VQVVTAAGEVAFDDVWVFGHAEADRGCSFYKIDISPVLSTTSPPQVPRTLLRSHPECHSLGQSALPPLMAPRCVPHVLANPHVHPPCSMGVLAN